MKATHVSLVILILTLLSCVNAAPPIKVTPAQQERVFFGNLHSHTTFSDGSDTLKEAYRFPREASNARLDFLALTEHNHAAVCRRCQRIVGAQVTVLTSRH